MMSIFMSALELHMENPASLGSLKLDDSASPHPDDSSSELS